MKIWCRIVFSVSPYLFLALTVHNLSLTLPADVDDSEEEMVTIDEGTHRGMILSHTIATLPARQWQVLQDSWSRGSFLELASCRASKLSQNIYLLETDLIMEFIRFNQCSTLTQ